MITPLHIHTSHITFGHDKYVLYPVVCNPDNGQCLTHINELIKQQALNLVDQQVGGNWSTVETLIGQYEIKNNQRNILSLTQSNYIYFNRAAHGMTVLASLTFDASTGQSYTLASLFKPNANYVERLSQLVAMQIKQRNMQVINPFTSIAPDQPFYVADKALVLYFQLYDLLPYAAGFPFFPISVYDIADIIDEAGPLGVLMS